MDDPRQMGSIIGSIVSGADATQSKRRNGWPKRAMHVWNTSSTRERSSIFLSQKKPNEYPTSKSNAYVVVGTRNQT